MKTISEIRQITKEEPYQVVFVCLGNICRSPTGEGLFQHLVNERGLEHYFVIDSAGTAAYHVGEPANSKSRMIAKERGVELHSKARQFSPSDFGIFDLIIAMDKENKKNILALAGSDADKNKVMLMRDFDPKPGDGNVPDPYYGGLDGFVSVFDIVKRSCASLLDQLQPHIK